ncbi:MAG: septum site-determining protein MinC [Pseudomonadales bacterium]|nr:septum site-determining protein MinC [Pseudomonadales bacterium]
MTKTEDTIEELKNNTIPNREEFKPANEQNGGNLQSKASLNNSQPPSGPTFNLKGSQLTLMVLELHEFHFDRFNQQMTQATQRAPNFFQQTPVVLSLEKLSNPNENIDFIDLSQLCQEYGLYPVAIKGGSEEHQLAAIVAGLPRIPASKNRESLTPQKQDSSQNKETKSLSTKAPVDTATLSAISQTVTRPVRSGQQIYAQGGDLIVLAPVSAGAEVLADGNIHVYGPLRGRALAGVKGNSNARIFCHSLEAELISIAGHYKVSEDLRSQPLWKQPMQARLDSKHLIIEKI